MKCKTQHLSSKAAFKRPFYYSAMLLCLASNIAWGDNTRFSNNMGMPDDQPAKKPPKFSKLIQGLGTKPAPLAVQAGAPLPITKPCPVAQQEAPLPVAQAPAPQPRPVVRLDALPQPIPVIKQEAPQPIEETLPSQQQVSSSEEILFSKVSEERSPLAILDANQDPQMQQWVLYASASRGAKKGIVEIVQVYGDKSPSSRGEDVKALLIKMGIQPEQLRVIYAKGDKPLAEKVYLFVKEKGQ